MWGGGGGGVFGYLGIIVTGGAKTFFGYGIRNLRTFGGLQICGDFLGVKDVGEDCFGDLQKGNLFMQRGKGLFGGYILGLCIFFVVWF